MSTIQIEKYALYVTDGTDGGDSVEDDWQQRSLTHERYDPSAIGTLDSGGVSLQPGTYRVSVRAAAWAVGETQLRLRVGGTLSYAGSPTWQAHIDADEDSSRQAWVMATHYFTITTEQTMLIEQYTELEVVHGLGHVEAGPSFDTLVVCEIWKLEEITVEGAQGPPGQLAPLARKAHQAHRGRQARMVRMAKMAKMAKTARRRFWH